MKRVRYVGTGFLLLLLGITAPIFADQQDQSEQQDKGKERQDQKEGQQQRAQRQQQDQNKGHEQHAQQQQQDQNKGRNQVAQRQDNRPSQQVQRVQQSEQRQVWQEHRAQNWQSEHRDWQQRGGYNGYRIPEEQYRGNFGQNHAFRVDSYPMEVYDGYPRFQYSGLWFGFMDRWPEYWSNDWYDNDDVYIVYSDDGYYLYNRQYPRDRIAVTVYLN